MDGDQQQSASSSGIVPAAHEAPPSALKGIFSTSDPKKLPLLHQVSYEEALGAYDAGASIYVSHR